MRVRHILPGFGIVPTNLESDSMSGIVSAAYHLAREQADKGWKMELVGLAKPGGPVSKTVELCPGLKSVPIRPWRRLQLGNYDFRYLAPLLFRLSGSPAVDLHHVYSNPYLLTVGRAVKRVIHYQTPIGEVPQMYQRAISRADAVICCSGFIRDQFLGQLDYPAERVFVVYNGADLELFKPAERKAIRVRLGLPEEGTIVLFAGQVNEDKGLLYLVRACRLLAKEHDFRLLIAGSSSLWGGPEMASKRTPYEEQIATEAAGLNTTFLGKTASGEMPLVYQAADVFVCPSIWDDPFPLVNIEAMASGLPVVASRAGGIPEAIQDGETGIVVPPADAEALASALRKLLVSPNLRQQMARESIIRAQDYSWKAIDKEVVQVYESIESK